jgi:hypothetical protein
MNEMFATGLAEATAHWLAYKQLSGFESLLSEALLMIPVAEYLIEHGYHVAAEQDTKRLDFGFGEPGEANYDIAAKKGDDRLLLEMKYLKKSEDQRIIKDFIKLALPPQDSKYERLFLIGYHSGKRRPANAQQTAEYSEQIKSTLIEWIRTAKLCEFKVSRNADVDLYLDGKPLCFRH